MSFFSFFGWIIFIIHILGTIYDLIVFDGENKLDAGLMVVYDVSIAVWFWFALQLV